MRRLLLLSLTCAWPLAAQSGFFSRFSFGVTGGVPLNDYSNNPVYTITLSGNFPQTPFPVIVGNKQAQRFTVGPNAEYAITDHFSVQFNPLYKRFTADYPVLVAARISRPGDPVGPAFYLPLIREMPTNAWEFPIIAKYTFGRPPASWRFFLGSGYSFGSGWQQIQGNFADTSGPTLTIVPIDSSVRTPTVSAFKRSTHRTGCANLEGCRPLTFVS